MRILRLCRLPQIVVYAYTLRLIAAGYNHVRGTMREKLAALAHRQWSGWMKYLFSKSIQNPDGSVTIPLWAVDRWKRQIDTRYSELSEEEKQSDRNEADRVLKIVSASNKPVGGKVILPFPLPTWNRILGMNRWHRMKLRNWIKDAVSISIREGFDSLTRTESLARLQLMGLSMADYYQMIRPSTSKKSPTRRRKSVKKRVRKR